MTKRFAKSFTQQEPIPEAGVAAAEAVLRSGRLHRYNLEQRETGETAALEAEYAAFQGTPHCVAVTSGGQAIQIALRAAGVVPGTKVLANAYTLAPVPGALHAVGAVPVFVEVGRDWTIDIDDLRARATESGARFLLLSHMRGHIVDMGALTAVCDELNITLIEDCAHTMGASWNGIRSGNHGKLACFSTQTYKHLNSGEGGFLTTGDPELAARATILSGSYMLYARHGAGPPADAFDAARWEMPNCSARMDHLRAAILRAQLPHLETNVRRWNDRYRVLEEGFRSAPSLSVPARPAAEGFVGSSIQFHADGISDIPGFLAACLARGVELKWFGADTPTGFTSRYDSWRYFGPPPDLPQTRAVLATTCDMRIPLTFTEADCALIAEIVAEEADRFSG